LLFVGPCVGYLPGRNKTAEGIPARLLLAVGYAVKKTLIWLGRKATLVRLTPSDGFSMRRAGLARAGAPLKASAGANHSLWRRRTAPVRETPSLEHWPHEVYTKDHA